MSQKRRGVRGILVKLALGVAGVSASRRIVFSFKPARRFVVFSTALPLFSLFLQGRGRGQSGAPSAPAAPPSLPRSETSFERLSSS